MQVIEVKPYGYCAGVVLAFQKALNAAKEYKGKRIYLLGMLVHNEEGMKLLSEQGLILIDEKKHDFIEALSSLEEGDVVIFSAHGHPSELDAIAKRKGLIVIDATCVHVKENELAAKEDIASGNEVIYLGSKGHLESRGFLANVKEAAFYDVKSGEFEEGKIVGDAPKVYSQTTLSSDEIELALSRLIGLYPNLSKGRLRCFATELRQTSLRKEAKNADAVVVLGSKTSNNSLKLAEIAKKEGKPVYLCLNLEDVKKSDLSRYKTIALASGASTSKETFLSVKEYLENLTPAAR